MRHLIKLFQIILITGALAACAAPGTMGEKSMCPMCTKMEGDMECCKKCCAKHKGKMQCSKHDMKHGEKMSMPEEQMD